MEQTLTVDCRTSNTQLVNKSVDLLARTLRERSNVAVSRNGHGPAGLVLDVQPGPGTEGYRIESGPGGAMRITGNDERGLLYGIGRFLRGSTFGENGFVPSTWRGSAAPEKQVRGMYFATHFHNFYHDAPVEEVERYVEELALWGHNALAVWFDMHHYTGIDDPEARAMIERLHRILKAANDVGMGAALVLLGNEAYCDSPRELRAVPNRGSHYHVELCPNIPGAMDLLLQWRQEVFDAFSDLDIRHVIIWPYDQGGCLCERCAPWGANGFLTVAREVAGLARRTWPKTAPVLSTWWFDSRNGAPGEYEGVWKAFARKPDWIDALMVDAPGGFPRYPIEHGAPDGMAMLNFPEISMHRMKPWGGFGANPLPNVYGERWHDSQHLLDGGFPYSEGIFEDINKAVLAQLYWQPDRPVMEIVAEYAAYEYGPGVAESVTDVVARLERAQQHYVADKDTLKNWAESTPDDTVLYECPKIAEPGQPFERLQQAESKLTKQARQAWRWRILWLRAALDSELHRSGGRATPTSERCFEELTDIYHAARAIRTVAPPTRQALKRHLREGRW